MTSESQAFGAPQIQAMLLNEVRNSAGHELFTANCLLDLVGVLDRAANEMVQEQRVGPADLDRATGVVRSLLEAMGAERQVLGYVEFREDILQRALARLGCPGIWPIC